MNLGLTRADRQAPTKQDPSRAGRRENNYDALRLLAALSVVVQHATIHLDAQFLWYTPGNGLWFPDGVAVFFILSGAMVYASGQKCRSEGRPMWDYLLNRLLRIAPAIWAYLAAMTAALFVLKVIELRDASDPHLWGWMISNVLLVPVYQPSLLAGFGTGVMNGSLWTIPAEASFYLIVPALVWASARFGFWRMIAVAMTVGVSGTLTFALMGGQNTERLDGKLLGVTFLPWLGYFVIGIVAARLWDRLPQSWVLAALSTAVYCGMWAWRRAAGEHTTLLVALAAALPLAYLTFWVGHHGPAVLRKATKRIGDLSFGTYIWHMPLVNLLMWFGVSRSPLHGTALVAAVVVGTVILASLSWHLVEKPALRLKRYSSRPAQRDA